MENLNKKLLEQSCKRVMLDIVSDNKYLKENVTFRDHVQVCKKVTKLSYVEVISLMFNKGEILDEFGIRDFESRFKVYLKYGLAAIAGGAVAKKLGASAKAGLAVGAVIMYLFRKGSDPCYQSCFRKYGKPIERTTCKYECHVNAAKNIVSDIRSEINKCSQQPFPKRCEKALMPQYIKWSKKLQDKTIKLRQSKVRQDEKERNNRAKQRNG